MDRALFIVMAALPLLPAGPRYFGADGAPFLDAVLVVLAVLLVVQAVVGRTARDPRDDDAALLRPAGLDLIAAAWMLFVAAATGAALVGIAAENVLDSPVFSSQLAGFSRLLGAVDRTSEPLVSLNAWFVVVRGLLAYLLVCALIGRATNPRRRARAALAGWLSGFAAVAALAVVQYLTGYGLHPFWVEVNPLLNRSHATLDDPNALGSYLALGVFVCIGCVLAARPAPRWVSVLLLSVGGAALLASGSRAALGAVLVAGLVAAARYSRLRRAAGWALAAFGLIVAASTLSRLFLPATPTDYRPDNVVAAVVSSLDPRVPLPEVLENRGIWWVAALDMWRDHPIVGVGLARFPRLLSTYTGGAAAGLDAHGYFLQVAAEAGALGLLSLLLLLAAVFARLRADAGVEPGFGVATGILFGSAAYVATFATGHPLLLTSGQTLWACLLAIAVAGRPATFERDSRGVPRALVAVACVVTIGLYAVGAALVPGPSTGGRWGYAYGLYPEEADEEGTFRWTGDVALLQFELPAAAEALMAEFAVAPALRAGTATEVRLFVSQRGSAEEEFTPTDFVVRSFAADQAFTAALQLDERFARSSDVLLRIEVSPVFVPARLGGSDDDRELGVRLRPLRFSGSR